MTSALAPAREIDVFITERVKPIGNAGEPRRGRRAIEKQLLIQRKQAFQRARAALESSRYRNLLIDVVEWLESLRSTPKEAGRTRIGTFAEETLKRRIRKLHKQGRHLECMSPRDGPRETGYQRKLLSLW